MLLQLIFDFFSGRAKTRIYSTFLWWFLVLHIDILFITFLIDQNLIYESKAQLKGEYLISYISYFGAWSILIELVRIVLSGLITYLMIWKLPKLINAKSYEQELEVEYALREMKINKEEKLNEREKESVSVQAEIIETEKQNVAERAKIEDSPEEVIWDQEFKKFATNLRGKQALREAKKTICGDEGSLYKYETSGGSWKTPAGISPDYLALLDTNGLIEFKENGRSIMFTKKGKHFLKLLDMKS